MMAEPVGTDNSTEIPHQEDLSVMVSNVTPT
jgi:hypothetical protein